MVDAVCHTNTGATVCGANSHVCMTRSIYTNNNAPGCDARPHTSAIVSISIDNNVVGPDANVNASSVNVHAAMRHFNSSVANFKAAQQCLQQQEQQQYG
jgi:hypothetical protein